MSITTWTRLQPVARDRGMQNSIEASVHDPLWMLARQWQLGEFRGEDAGSPALVELRAVVEPVTRFTPSADPSEVRIRTEPLEALVERERVRDGRAVAGRLAAEAGQQFLRLLAAKGVKKYQAAYVKTYAMAPPTAAERRTLDAATLRFRDVMGGRVPDGVRLYASLAPVARGGVFPGAPAVLVADRPKVLEAITAWVTWYEEALFNEPPATTTIAPAWVPQRMEYAFAVHTERLAQLAAPEYVEGHLDWYSFDVRSMLSSRAVGTVATHALIPAPVTFRGMPASRYWEFEDARVNLSAVEADSVDIGRLVLLEFALAYGNDWFVVPIELAVGSACVIEWLLVTDTFGERAMIRPSGAAPGAPADWTLFTLGAERRADGMPAVRALRPLFLLAPALVSSLQSPPIEEVLFIRDEMANLAWAVERIVESPVGQPLNRYDAFQEKRRRTPPTQPRSADEVATLAYQLGTEVPDHWFPLVPELRGASMLFRRGSVGSAQRPLPLGRILNAEARLELQEEEVPRGGARVTRAYQYARWIDGSTHLWIGRRKQPGRGEGSSGLQFDRARRSEPAR
jgi:hypothetical protein